MLSSLFLSHFHFANHLLIVSIDSPGSKIDVIVDEVNIANQKLVLAMKGAKAANGKNDDAFLSTLPQGKWIQAIVQSVNKFALFLRPAGHDKTSEWVSSNCADKCLTFVCFFRSLFAPKLCPS